MSPSSVGLSEVPAARGERMHLVPHQTAHRSMDGSALHADTERLGRIPSCRIPSSRTRGGACRPGHPNPDHARFSVPVVASAADRGPYVRVTPSAALWAKAQRARCPARDLSPGPSRCGRSVGRRVSAGSLGRGERPGRSAPCPGGVRGFSQGGRGGVRPPASPARFDAGRRPRLHRGDLGRPPRGQAQGPSAEGRPPAGLTRRR